MSERRNFELKVKLTWNGSILFFHADISWVCLNDYDMVIGHFMLTHDVTQLAISYSFIEVTKFLTNNSKALETEIENCESAMIEFINNN